VRGQIPGSLEAGTGSPGARSLVRRATSDSRNCSTQTIRPRGPSAEPRPTQPDPRRSGSYSVPLAGAGPLLRLAAAHAFADVLAPLGTASLIERWDMKWSGAAPCHAACLQSRMTSPSRPANVSARSSSWWGFRRASSPRERRAVRTAVRAQEAGCEPGGPVSTVGTYSSSWSPPSNVRPATISRVTSGYPS
jgi:hypothetical protein